MVRRVIHILATKSTVEFLTFDIVGTNDVDWNITKVVLWGTAPWIASLPQPVTPYVRTPQCVFQKVCIISPPMKHPHHQEPS